MKSILRSVSGGSRTVGLVAALLMTTGCQVADESTSTSPSATLTTNTFSGSLSQNGTAVHNFSVSSSGYTLLAGYTSISPSSITSLGLGIGTWDSSTSTCGLNQTQLDAAKSGSTALSATANSGSYCVRVYDGGNITSGTTVTYTVQVQHY